MDLGGSTAVNLSVENYVALANDAASGIGLASKDELVSVR